MGRSLTRWLLLSALVRAVWAGLRGTRVLLLGAGVVSAVLVGCGSLNGLMGSQPETPKGRAQVVSVADGDTITIRDGSSTARVRLLGIDTPEIGDDECGARHAKARTVQLLARRPVDRSGDGLADAFAGGGRRVRLQTNSAGEQTDHYGRLLAYVYVGRRPVSVQEILVREGLATVYRFRGRDLDLADRLEDARVAARRAKRGIWGELGCGGDFHSNRPGVQR